MSNEQHEQDSGGFGLLTLVILFAIFIGATCGAGRHHYSHGPRPLVTVRR